MLAGTDLEDPCKKNITFNGTTGLCQLDLELCGEPTHEHETTWGRWRCAMYWLSAVILAVYSEDAALRWISRVVTMPPRKVQMHIPQNRLTVVSQQSAAVAGSCRPYPARMWQHTLSRLGKDTTDILFEWWY